MGHSFVEAQCECPIYPSIIITLYIQIYMNQTLYIYLPKQIFIRRIIIYNNFRTGVGNIYVLSRTILSKLNFIIKNR